MSNDDNIIDLPTRIKQMRNLKPYRNKSDDEIERIILNRQNKPKVPSTRRKGVEPYDKRFNDKLESLQTEYAVDMNNSNDVEALKSLVRFQIQLENVNRDIDAIQSKETLREEDYRSLKNLGDFQTGISRSVAELQDKLGISRKQRKEKQVDDFPQFMDSLLKRGAKMFEEKTVKVVCPRDSIELARVWYNFPNLNNETQMSLQCWKCKEQIEYAR